MPSYAITGAARGLGFEHIRQLSADPANTVFALVRNIGTATKLRDLAAQRPNVHVLQGDVTKPDELASAAAAVAAITSGSLDVLIHNATASLNPDEFLAPSQLPSDSAALRAAFDPMFSTNIYGAVWVTNAFLPLVEKGTVKKIIHLSSGMSDIDCVLGAGIDYTVPYAVSKSGTNMLVAKYAVELAPKGIKVLALSPGWVNTSEDTGESIRFYLVTFPSFQLTILRRSGAT